MQRDAVIEIHPGDAALGLDLGELEPAVLEIDDRLPERLALARIGEGPFEHRFHRGDRADADQQPLARQLLHQIAEAASFVAEPVADRHPDIVEEQFGSVLRLEADLFQIAPARETGASASTMISVTPFAPAEASVLAMTMTRSATGRW